MLIPLGDDLEKRDLPFAAIGLIAVCTIVHLFAFRLSLDGLKTGQSLAHDFVRTWGVIPADVARGEFTGLATHMFLHGDWFHLIGNALMLYVFAASLEQGLGAVRFVILYLLAGVVGGVAHVAMNPGESIPMIGASGAVFGVIGAYFIAFGAMANMNALLILGPARTRVTLPAGAYVFFWIILEQMLGLVIEEELGNTGTAWYAHVGGFAVGAVSMLFLKPFVKSRMILNRDGKLEFVESPPPAAAAEVAVAAMPDVDEPAGLPCECPHCHTPLAETDRLADELYRCPNGTCKRLVYPSRLTTAAR